MELVQKGHLNRGFEHLGSFPEALRQHFPKLKPAARYEAFFRLWPECFRVFSDPIPKVLGDMVALRGGPRPQGLRGARRALHARGLARTWGSRRTCSWSWRDASAAPAT
jgi:hypothetical protein